MAPALTRAKARRSSPRLLQHLNLTHINTLVFAGGGNRCWWQAGLVTQLLEAGWRLPAQLVGTSAGAGVATALITGKVVQAMQACRALYADNPRIVDWSNAWMGQLGFAHTHIYPAWIASYLNDSTFETMRSSPSRLRVAFARPVPWLGLPASIVAGTLAYLVDKHICHSIHPQLPGFLGLKQGFMDLHDCPDLAAAQNLLYAAGAVPPLMRARTIAGRPALDGGFVDNAPIGQLPQADPVPSRASTLVLLTRHYPRLPELFAWQGRNYWQPSCKVPVSTFDCTPKTTVQAAYDLGTLDAQIFLTTPFQSTNRP